MWPSTMPTTGLVGDFKMSPGRIADSAGLVASGGLAAGDLSSAGLVSTLFGFAAGG
jgi:hypothetical protein